MFGALNQLSIQNSNEVLCGLPHFSSSWAICSTKLPPSKNHESDLVIHPFDKPSECPAAYRIKAEG